MRPTWLLSGQGAGSDVRCPVLLGRTLLGALDMLARYFRVANANDAIGDYVDYQKLVQSAKMS